MKRLIREAISTALTDGLGLDPGQIPAFSIEASRQASHGDFATNAAMLLARRLKRPPRDIAVELVEKLAALEFVARVEVAGPGFVNLFIEPGAFQRVAYRVLAEGDDFGSEKAEKPEKILVEFVSANPTGPLHFGHGRGAVVGDVLANLLSYSGHEVTREFYVNDAGAQVDALARSVVWRLMQQAGSETPFPEDGYRGDYVAGLAGLLPEKLAGFPPGEPDQETLDAIRDLAIAKMLVGIRSDLDAFGVRMDHFTSEREVVGSGRVAQAFSELEKGGLLERRDGALWFSAERFGDEKPRVLVKKNGDNTYFATDIAYHLDKLRRGHQRLINVWGADHHGYVPRMKAALQALGRPPGALEIVLVQMVSLLRDGQPIVLSKRKGEIISLREVVEEVGRDAARFFFLLRGTDSQIEFDLELAKKKSLDNPVFYVQYGHARLSSILAKAKERGIDVPDPTRAQEVDLAPLVLDEEIRLLGKMADFPETVRRAAGSRAPHLIVFYVQELASDFHSYYTQYGRSSPILGGDPGLIAARLIMVQALRQVIRCALALIGVSAPDRMESQGEQAL
ncbi:MAG TPA: arginine--tRNA ligase [Myxococcota bacterium]|nr:arginine--tRNA ligase [Myxococcota bacterium]